jgi:hypothetical protein
MPYRRLAILGMVLVPALYAAPAQAVPAHVYVSAVTGSDSGDCSNAASPCQTLTYAHGQVAAGGLISITGGGDFAPLTVTKSVTIQGLDVPARIVGDGISAASLVINAAVTDTVTLKSLDIVGGTAGPIGIQINTVGKIYILNCTIRGFTAGVGNAIQFIPSGNTSGNSQLYASNVEVSNTSGGLISVRPTDATYAKVFFNRVEVHNGLFGIRSDGTNGRVDNAIRDSAFFSLTNAGVTAVSSSNLVRVSYDKSTVLNAGTAAVLASGTAAHIVAFDVVIEGSANGVSSAAGGSVVIDNTVITGNGVGAVYDSTAGGGIFSCGNNMIKFNTTDVSGAITAGCGLQ